MYSINKIKRQKSKGKNIILLLTIYGVMLANPISQSNQIYNGIVMMPEMTVTAQRPTENVVMMPGIVVTATIVIEPPPSICTAFS